MPELNSEMAEHPMSTPNLYEADFYAWTQQQATLLRNQQWHRIDVPNLIEEIESLGKQQRQELRNRLSILVEHLLKYAMCNYSCPHLPSPPLPKLGEEGV
jgi:hypothetical protein